MYTTDSWSILPPSLLLLASASLSSDHVRGDVLNMSFKSYVISRLLKFKVDKILSAQDFLFIFIIALALLLYFLSIPCRVQLLDSD